MSFMISIEDIKTPSQSFDDMVEDLNQKLDEAMREGNVAWAQELEWELDQLTSNI